VVKKQRKTTRVLLMLTLIWSFSGCAYQQPPLQPTSEATPPAVEIRPETRVSEPVTPIEQEPETPVKPKLETVVIAPKASDLKMPKHKPHFFLHKVRWPEETLSHIAKWYTGTAKNWGAIAKVNPELDPKKIDIGDTISIPKDLLTTHKPLPHFFVQPQVHIKSRPKTSPKEISISPELPKLFEPIESEPLVQNKDPAKLFGPVDAQQPSIKSDTTTLFGPVE
jgi:hypothetical protein